MFKDKISKTFQVLNLDTCYVLYEFKWNIFGFWTGQTTELKASPFGSVNQFMN